MLACRILWWRDVCALVSQMVRGAFLICLQFQGQDVSMSTFAVGMPCKRANKVLLSDCTPTGRVGGVRTDHSLC